MARPPQVPLLGSRLAAPRPPSAQLVVNTWPRPAIYVAGVIYPLTKLDTLGTVRTGGWSPAFTFTLANADLVKRPDVGRVLSYINSPNGPEGLSQAPVIALENDQLGYVLTH